MTVISGKMLYTIVICEVSFIVFVASKHLLDYRKNKITKPDSQ